MNEIAFQIIPFIVFWVDFDKFRCEKNEKAQAAKNFFRWARQIKAESFLLHNPKDYSSFSPTFVSVARWDIVASVEILPFILFKQKGQFAL